MYQFELQFESSGRKEWHQEFFEENDLMPKSAHKAIKHLAGQSLVHDWKLAQNDWTKTKDGRNFGIPKWY